MGSSTTPATTVRRLFTSTIKPNPIQEDNPMLPLTPWDLPLLSINYIQKGLLFSSHQNPPPLHRLKHSLSLTLSIFYPLAGRLLTLSHPTSSSIFIHCNAAGAEFIHASADLTLSDVLAPVDVPPVVSDFFPLNEAVAHDGHFLPLLAVQLTELKDGFFLGCSFNHVVGDGSAFWHFFTSWAEITRTGTTQISRRPVLERWFMDGNSDIRIPYTNPEEFIKRFTLPPLRERFFHFTRESVSRLKARANEEAKTEKISSFQALSALVWRGMVRAMGLAGGDTTFMRFSIDFRSRLKPPLPLEYHGNAIGTVTATATAGEVLDKGLGWAAGLLNDGVAVYGDAEVRRELESWVKAPRVYNIEPLNAERGEFRIGSSPRFDVYGVDFGWGKAEAVRVGVDNKFDGKITAFPGREEMGSVDLEICLSCEDMKALESDEEFMHAVTGIPLEY